MPMYEYKCKKKCQKIEEILQGYDEPAPQCEKCKEA